MIGVLNEDRISPFFTSIAGMNRVVASQQLKTLTTNVTVPLYRGRTLLRGARLCVRAQQGPPKGVTQPPRSPVVPPPKFGFVDNAEVLNSRAAMIGFFALLLVEAVFNKGLLELMGVTVGKGLDIGL